MWINPLGVTQAGSCVDCDANTYSTNGTCTVCPNRELGLPLYWLYLAVCVMPASRDRRGAVCFVHPGHIFYEDPIRVQHVSDDALPAIRKFNGAQH